MAMGFPFQGLILYQKEPSYNYGFSTASTRRISDTVTDVRIETGDMNIKLRSISEPSVQDYSQTMKNPTLHVEWVEQPNASDSLASYCYNRTDGDLHSLAFEVAVNRHQATSAYYRLAGCKAKTLTKSGSAGEHWTYTADFSVASLSTATASSASITDPGAIGTAYATFNTAGAITWAGVTLAYVTQSIDFTVENNLTEYWDVGSTEIKAAIPGALDITGSCDISLDDGGKVHFDEVLANTAITSIILNTGLTTGNFGKVTLNDGRFDSTNIDVSTGGEGIISSVPFTFKTLTFATGT